MDHFANFHAVGDNASYDFFWDNMQDPQTQVVQGPVDPVNDCGYDAYLLDGPLDQFVDQQRLVENKGSAGSLSYEGLMNIDFTQRNEYLGDTDLFALPSTVLAADIQTPPAAPQVSCHEYLHCTPTYTSPVADSFGPLVALPGSQSQSPQTTPPTLDIHETSSHQEPGRYRNHILNFFLNPLTPLSLIDNLLYPFGQELQTALERALQRQQTLFQSGYLAATKDMTRREEEDDEDQFVSREFHSFLTPLPRPLPPRTSSRDLTSMPSVMDSITLPPPIPTGFPTSAPALQRAAVAPMGRESNQDNELDSKTHGNRRPLNIKNFDAGKFYTPLASHPEPWGSINPETNEPIFKYTAFGELDPLSTFTPAQISEYISQHPLNKKHKDAGLRLLIQTVPADSGRRYPNRASEKCRFEGCPDSLRTIRKGDFRVAFDEQSSQCSTTDPFHNAGYVHLFCLEKFLDFPQLCKDFNVQPDVRILPEGKNKMAITRDHSSMEGIVRSFISQSKPWNRFGNGIRPLEYYNHTLNYMLTQEHLKKQPKHLQKIRTQRGGVSIDLHMNNLDSYVKMRRAHRNKSDRKAIIQNKGKKRRRDESSDNNESDKDVLEEVFRRTRISPRAMKRLRY